MRARLVLAGLVATGVSVVTALSAITRRRSRSRAQLEREPPSENVPTTMKSAVVISLGFGKWQLPPELARVAEPRYFGVPCHIRYGVAGSDAVGDAQLTVMSPQYLLDYLPDNDILLGREFVFQNEFNPQLLAVLLSRYAASCTGLTDSDVLERVSKVGHYEFDDYDRPPAIRQLVQAEGDGFFPLTAVDEL